MTVAAPEQTDTEDLALARVLCREAGVGEPRSVARLAGGRNNRVARVDLADGSRVVLKRYHHDPRDSRDRLGAEWSFLAYAAARGIAAVPRPLARRAKSQAALYSFVEGRKLGIGEVEATHVEAALDLVRRLNAPPRMPSRLAPGSEACFTLGNHLATIDRRVARLGAIASEAPLAEAARALVADRLAPRWVAMREQIERDAAAQGLGLATPIAEGETCISPSDFGYHNALINDAGLLTFIDFEYAGRDDPAKLVCDFFCQPEVPVPLAHFDRFAEGVAAALDLSDAANARMRLLLDAYRIKWTCIMLNDFLPMDAARRAFADQGARAERCRTQLFKAGTALAAIGAT